MTGGTSRVIYGAERAEVDKVAMFAEFQREVRGNLDYKKKQREGAHRWAGHGDSGYSLVKP